MQQVVFLGVLGFSPVFTEIPVSQSASTDLEKLAIFMVGWWFFYQVFKFSLPWLILCLQ